MPSSILMSLGQSVLKRVRFLTEAGAEHAPVRGGCVSVDNASVVEATLSGDGQRVALCALKDGEAVVHYVLGAIADTLHVRVGVPAVARVAFADIEDMQHPHPSDEESVPATLLPVPSSLLKASSEPADAADTSNPAVTPLR